MSRSQWLMPIILATWEAEIRGSQFKTSPGKKVCKTPSQWKKYEHGGTCLLSQQCWKG
jgi:hypothetical protein